MFRMRSSRLGWTMPQPGPLAWGQTGIDRTQQVCLGFPQCELAFVNFRDPPGQLIVRGVGPNGLSQLIGEPLPAAVPVRFFPSVSLEAGGERVQTVHHLDPAPVEHG